MTLKLILKKMTALFNKSIEKKPDSDYYDDLKLLKKLLSYNNIQYHKINSLHTIIAFDYTDKDYEDIKEKIKNGEFRKEDKSKEKEFTWDKNHIHFQLVILDNEMVFAYAVIFPYEPLLLPQVIWFEKLNGIQNEHLSELMNYEIHSKSTQ